MKAALIAIGTKAPKAAAAFAPIGAPTYVSATYRPTRYPHNSALASANTAISPNIRN
jgi:hypothetical protein